MKDNEYVIVNGELYHYGVPGMKWGVRNFDYDAHTNSGWRKQRRVLRNKRTEAGERTMMYNEADYVLTKANRKVNKVDRKIRNTSNPNRRAKLEERKAKLVEEKKLLEDFRYEQDQEAQYAYEAAKKIQSVTTDKKGKPTSLMVCKEWFSNNKADSMYSINTVEKLLVSETYGFISSGFKARAHNNREFKEYKKKVAEDPTLRDRKKREEYWKNARKSI